MRIIGFLFVILLLLFLSGYGTDIPYSIVYYNESGVLTTPDSLRVDMVFFPSEDDTSFLSEPTSAKWDTMVSISGVIDNFVEINYTIFDGIDSLLGSEFRYLRFDTSFFSESYWGELADRADSGIFNAATIGLYVWTYGTRTVTDKTGFSLSATERQAIADSVQNELERPGGLLSNVAYFWAACSNCTQVYYPNTGSSPKDSVVTFDGSGIRRMKITYKHSNVNTILDSTVTLVVP